MRNYFFKSVILILLFIPNLLNGTIANTPIANPDKLRANHPDYKWSTSSYVGYAWSGLTGVVNPNPDLFNQAGPGDSEDCPLGNIPYAGFSIGRRVCKWCIINFSYDVYGAFGYRRYHANGILPTQVAGHEILGSNYVRSFAVDHQAAMFNLYVNFPKNFGLTVKNMHILPVCGAGAGAGISKVKVFQAVGYSSLASYGQTTTLASPNTNISLAWTAGVGLVLKPQNSAVSFGLGYRYCHGGEFFSSSEYVLNDPLNQGENVKLAPWTGSVKTQELKMFVNAEF